MSDTPTLEPTADEQRSAWNAGVEDIAKESPNATPSDPPATTGQTDPAPADAGVAVSGDGKTEPEQKLEVKATGRKALLEQITDPALREGVERELNRAASQVAALTRVQRNPGKSLDLIALEAKSAKVKAGVEALKQDFPEIAAGFSDLPAFLDQVVEPVRRAEQQASAQVIEADIDAAFKDWKTQVNTPQFGTWLNANPSMKAKSYGGILDTFDVLQAYESHALTTTGRSPFDPAPAAPAASAAVDAKALAAQITEQRAARLKSAAPIPNGTARANKSIDATDPRSAWNAGVEQVRRERRTE